MSWAAIAVFLVVLLPLLGFLGWTLWQEASVRIGQRQVGLVIVRGKPTDRALAAGKHFVSPFSQDVEVYPDHELAYATVPEGVVEWMESRGVDFADPPLGVADGGGTLAGLRYTIRFRLTRAKLRQVHERFGPAGIRGILRDESRHVISAFFIEDGHWLLDLLGAGRGPMEVELGERVRTRLSASGFEVTLFSLQEPDLRGLGEAIEEQMRAREAVTLEQIRASIEEVRDRRLETRARLETGLAAERIRTQAEAETASSRLRAEVEATVAEARTIRRALAAAKAREIEIAKQLQQVAPEAELELRRVEGVARWSAVLAQGLSPLVLDYRALEAWRAALERWDGTTPATVAPWHPQVPPIAAPPAGRERGTSRTTEAGGVDGGGAAPAQG